MQTVNNQLENPVKYICEIDKLCDRKILIMKDIKHMPLSLLSRKNMWLEIAHIDMLSEIDCLSNETD